MKTFELAAGTSSQTSTIPDLTLNEVPIISLTLGIAHNMELAAKGSYLHLKEDGQQTQRGSGDTELSFKWNFLPQTESSPYPAIAVTLTGIAATGTKNLNVGAPAHWGARCGLSIGREITWTDHVLGAYIDGQLEAHDLSDDRYKDWFGTLNIGLLYPISKYRNLQLIIEYNLVSGIDKISSVGGNYSGFTYGLRMVNERFNLTIGAQFLRNDVQGFQDASRIIGMGSIKF